MAAAAIVWCAVAAASFAQAPDPFAPAGAPPAGVDPFAPGGAPPAGGNPFGPGAAPAPGANPFGPGASPAPDTAAPPSTAAPASLDPLARRIMESNPQTVDELMAAISNLANLNEGDLVKSLVAKVRQANLDENAKANLEQRWGAGLFVKLALEPRYAPEAKTFAQEVLDAAKARLTALPHLNQVVSELVVDDPAKRQAAQAELRRAGEACFTLLLNVLGDASREQDKYVAATALLGDFVEPALHASLRCDNETLQTQAMRVLGVRRHDHSLPMILGIAWYASASDTLRAAARESLTSALGGVPSAEETVGFLRRRAKQFHSGAAVGSG
ncbi:MAG: hypothetical protein KDA47_01815, partial [Planctomycetales bacterium]|nr:hypothetical protein [Planctomycetales bacterium]